MSGFFSAQKRHIFVVGDCCFQSIGDFFFQLLAFVLFKPQLGLEKDKGDLESGRDYPL
jgi:hypothetical protein